jgi:hypothetical protein
MVYTYNTLTINIYKVNTGRSWIFSWAMRHISPTTNIGLNISVLSIYMYLNLKVIDVFSFHLLIFHWFVAPSSRRYFQGHSP